jgi:hypothetical protein
MLTQTDAGAATATLLVYQRAKSCVLRAQMEIVKRYLHGLIST